MTEEDSVSSEYTEEEQFFDYIHKGDSYAIRKKLKESGSALPIWDYKSKENQNSTVLHTSVFKKNLEITKILIEHCKTHNKEKLQSFIDSENDQGVTALHYASFRGDVEIIKLLVDNGADIFKITQKGLNVIHYCAQGNKPSSLMYFYFKLKENSNNNDKKFSLITSEDSGGSTPLHWAVYSVAEDLLLYLINLDIFQSEDQRLNFINKPDNQGYSPLHLCITSKSSRIALKLLQNGADASILDNKNKTPLDLAIEKRQNDIAQIIRNNQNCNFCNIKAPVKQIKKSPKNIICIFFFQIITFLIFFSSTFVTLFIHFESNSQIFGIYFNGFIVLFSLFFLIYFILLVLDPGMIEKNSLEDVRDLLNHNTDLTKYCYKCFIKKTKYSKHCIICDRCYNKFDHHCYWINKCVAKNNYIVFLLFLFEVFFYLVFILIISIIGAIYSFKQETKYEFIYDDMRFFIYNFFIDKVKIFENKFYHFGLNVILSITILSFLIPECLLLGFNVYVCCSNYRAERSRRETTSFSTTTFGDGIENNSLLLSTRSSKEEEK
mgnify:FL=1